MKTFNLKADHSNMTEVFNGINQETKWLREIAEENGYEINYPFWRDDELQIYFRPKGDNEYLPKIYVDKVGKFTKPTSKNQELVAFGIQTASYGSLNPEEFQKFLEAQNKALKLVNRLNIMTALDLQNMFPTVVIEK